MQIPDEHPFNPLQAILQQLVGRELPSLASRKAAKSSSEPAEKPKKEGFQAPYFFNEKYVQLLKAKAENKDIQDLLKWMGRFEKGLLDAVIASAPKAAGLFYELMIQERDKRTVPAETVRKVVLQFQRHCIFTHMKPHDDFTIKCPDGDVPINLTLMALFADFFQRLQSAGMKELKEDGRVVQFVHSRGAVENLKKYVQGGAKSLSDSDFDGLVELAMLANYVAFPELTQACIDELKKKIKTTDIPNENKLEIMLAQLEQLGAVTAEYHSLKIDAIARFCKAEIPHKESSDKKGCLIPLDALGLMQGDGVVANGLRSAVRGFEVSETSDSERVAERVADLEFMEE
ncbi:MAG TPA: hypothetical protein VN457_06320, partial [Chlamydiales bacterium]|nr:hypothetical protein [Chlamydiales bacterium]